MFGLGPDKFSGKIEEFLECTHPDDRESVRRAYFASIEAGKDDYEMENRIIKRDSGEIRHIKEKCFHIRDASGVPVTSVGIAQDITERKLNEQKLEKLLHEKDDLMKELNHRIKNNLTIISSLVKLKDSALGESADLSDLVHQIEAVKIIHEKLYRNDEITDISIRDYVKEFLENMFSSLTHTHVDVRSSIENLLIPTRTAIPLGLIINEIATNTVKYGLTAVEKPVFQVALKKTSTGSMACLTVSNNGEPIPEHINPDTTSTIGMQLISALTEQLEGNFHLEKVPHPVYTLQFLL